ncbi:MAG: ferrochelatase [Myxococcota bacterium]
MSLPAGPKTGLLLINLGTPDKPETPEVRRYLRQFLSDPRVVDLPAIPRWLLLNLIILPTRPARSAHAYRKIWTDRGSPLLFHSMDLREGVQRELGPDIPVALGMRYGNPSIESALTLLRRAGCSRVVVFPLYPQYASSSGGSSLEEVYRISARLWNVPNLSVVPPFFAHPAFIEAFRDVAAPVLQDFQPDHVLFSYHGVPERHVTRSDETGEHCLQSEACCATLGHANHGCYRAQCFATTRLIARALGLGEDKASLSFQSRLGRTPWIRPYTDEVLPELAKRGIKRLAVICPAFVADCLETLEEIGMRAREDYAAHGGELRLVPSLNSTPGWVRAVAQLAREAMAVPAPAALLRQVSEGASQQA